jgi:glucan 1,3-beta-glucosidase
VQVFAWCRKYGLRVNLDLHNVPGSANSKIASFIILLKLTFILQPLIMAARRVHSTSSMVSWVLRTHSARWTTSGSSPSSSRSLSTKMLYSCLASSMSHGSPGWVCPPRQACIYHPVSSSPFVLIDTANSSYLEAHNVIRSITGMGEGNGAYISIHDGFADIATWVGYLPNADRLALDRHPYFAFGGSVAMDPIDTGTGPGAGGPWPERACGWGPDINARCVIFETRNLLFGSLWLLSQSAFGVTLAGEFSNGFNDCGLFLLGVTGATSYGGDCSDWEDSSTWTPGTKAGIKNFALAQMDALQGWFFWTWKVSYLLFLVTPLLTSSGLR